MPDAITKRAMTYIAKNPGSRSAKVLNAILQNGGITTEDILRLGYKHAPRARQDCVDEGFPIKTERVPDSEGKSIARYSLPSEGEIRKELQGRAIISKAFKNKLIKLYGSCDHITGLELTPRALQVDHRIPFQISGDEGLWAEDVGAFMLLTGSSQRKKSFSCEQCPNFRIMRSESLCRTCYWAYPESYDHIGMRQVRQVTISWQDEETGEFDLLKGKLAAQGRTIEDAVKAYLRTILN